MLVVAMLVFSSTGTVLALPVGAASSNTIIKGSGPTLYWYSSNGKRYVFPNSKTFFSWYSQDAFANIQYVSDTELYGIPIGGNVTYRPGAKLIKIMTDPKVYAVSRYGVLRWITSETIASSLYGNNWRDWVEDVPDEFFVNYTIGSAIYSVNDYSVNQEYTTVTTPNFNIYDSGTGVPLAPTPVPSTNAFRADGFYLTTNKTTLYTYNTYGNSDSQAILTASILNPNTLSQNITIRIFKEDGTLVQTCAGSSCVYYANLSSYSSSGATYRYYATATNLDNQVLPTAWSPTIVVYSNNPTTPSYSGSITLSANKTQISNNDLVTLTTTASDASGAYNYWIDVYRSDTRDRVGSCSMRQTCSFNIYAQQISGQSSVNYYAVLRPGPYGYGTEIATSNTVTFYFVNTSNLATPYITYPSNGQSFSHYPRKITIRWSGSSERRTVLEVSCNSGCNPLAGISQPGPEVIVDNYGTSKELEFTRDDSYTIRVRSMNDSGLRSNASEPISFSFSTQSGTLSVTASRTSVSFGESVRYTASVSNSSFAPSTMRIRLYERRSSGSQNLLKECTGSSTCVVDSFPLAYGSSDTSVQPYAVMLDRSTNLMQITETYGPNVALQSQQSGTLSMNVSKLAVTSGETVSVSATANTSIPTSRLRIRLYDQNGSLFATCTGTVYCNFTNPVTLTYNANGTNTYRWRGVLDEITSPTASIIYDERWSDTVTVLAPTTTNISRSAWLSYANLTNAPDGGRRIHIRTSLDPITGITASTRLSLNVYDSRFTSPIYNCVNAYACEFDFNLGIPGTNEYLYSIFTVDGATITSPYYKVN